MNIYDQLKQLWACVTGLEKSDASLAPLIPKIPKDFLTTETATGLKWIDGKDIYKRVLTGKTPASDVLEIDFPYDTIIDLCGTVLANTGAYYEINSNIRIAGSAAKLKLVMFASSSSTFQNTDYNLIVYYTKSTAPSKSPDDEPETKATKAAKKKASK